MSTQAPFTWIIDAKHSMPIVVKLFYKLNTSAMCFNFYYLKLHALNGERRIKLREGAHDQLNTVVIVIDYSIDNFYCSLGWCAESKKKTHTSKSNPSLMVAEVLREKQKFPSINDITLNLYL